MYKLIQFKAVLSFVFIIVLTIFTIQNSEAGVVFVKHDATGGNNGISWESAYNNLSQAIEQANPEDVIWVGCGSYRPLGFPNGGEDKREMHFTLKNEVAIYGGFEGTEDPATFNLDGRDFEINETIISGYHPGIPFHISPYRVYHVFYHPKETDLDETAILDGFTISGGRADGAFPDNDRGGGILNRSSSPTIRNCTFAQNWAEYGGGIYNSTSHPSLTNVTVRDNNATSGGGIYNSYSDPNLNNAFICDNYASGGGGGIYNSISNPEIKNTDIINNKAGGNGGGILNTSSDPILNNVNIVDNQAENNGGGIHNYHSNLDIINTNIINNKAVKGGGIYNDNSSPTIIGVTIHANISQTLGGGIGNTHSSHATLTNVTISGNQAGTFGGGIFNSWSDPALTNVTISNNTSTSGLGMRNSQSSPIIKNCILWTSGVEGQEIYDFDNSFPAVSWSVVKGGYPDGANIVTADPLLQPLADNGGFTKTHAISRNSPAYAIPEDAGEGNWNGAPDTDQRGASRAPGDFRAMGAYEDSAIIQPGISVSYHTSDLQGTWYRQRISSGPSPQWNRATLTIDAAGNNLGAWEGSSGGRGTFSNVLKVLGNGEVRVPGQDYRLFLTPDRDMMVGVGKDPSGNPVLSLSLRQGSGFTTSDLAGTWKGFSLETGSFQGWGHSTVVISASGALTFNGSYSDGDSETFIGKLNMSGTGMVTLQEDPSAKGQLNRDKNVLVFTSGEKNNPIMMVFIKQGQAYQQSDLTGAWLNYELFTGSWQGWEESAIDIDGSGYFDFFILDSEGTTETGTIGPVSMLSSGQLSFEGATMRSMMTPDRSTMAIVQTEEGEHSLSILVKRAQTNYRTIRGRVTFNGAPVCTMVLINGQYAFTCDGTGEYELVVPLNTQGKATAQIFCSGMAPYRQTFTPSGDVTVHDVSMAQEERPSMDVTIDADKLSATQGRVRGTVSSNGTPVCAMVLINGKYMFSCNANLGVYDLTVPLDVQGAVTVQVFCAGLAPFRHTVTAQ